LASTFDNEDGPIKDSLLLRQGIPAMPPGKKIVALFDVSHDRLEAKLPITYTVRVELQDYQGRRQEPLEYVLDLSFQYGIQRVEIKTVHNVAKTLDKIERSINKWTQHGNGVRTWVRNEDAYLSDQRAEMRERRARLSAASEAEAKDGSPAETLNLASDAE
jgi:hypothetical protein